MGSVAKDERNHDSHMGSHCRELVVDLFIYFAVQLLFHHTKCTQVYSCEDPSILKGARIFFVSINVMLISCTCTLLKKIHSSDAYNADQEAADVDYDHVKKQMFKAIIKFAILGALHWKKGIVVPLVAGFIMAVIALPFVKDREHSLWYKYSQADARQVYQALL